jgi:hypothetical protein
MVAKVLDMKEALKQIVTNVEWDTYVKPLSDTHKKPVRRAKLLCECRAGSREWEIWEQGAGNLRAWSRN